MRRYLFDPAESEVLITLTGIEVLARDHEGKWRFTSKSSAFLNSHLVQEIPQDKVPDVLRSLVDYIVRMTEHIGELNLAYASLMRERK